MKKIVLASTLFLLLFGCGEGEPVAGASAMKEAAPSGGGSFSGRVGEQIYNVEVACTGLDQDWFMFRSDRTDSTDSNGDGLIVSGMQNGDKFILTIVDQGVKYSAGKLAKFNKNANGAQGSGTLWQDGASSSFDAEFTVTCD